MYSHYTYVNAMICMPVSPALSLVRLPLQFCTMSVISGLKNQLKHNLDIYQELTLENEQLQLDKIRLSHDEEKQRELTERARGYL